MKLTLEATNICPLPCHDNEKNRIIRPQGVMESTKFKSIIERFLPIGIREVEFGGSGEALLNPNILDFIYYIKSLSPTTKTTLISNGLLLTSKIGENLSKNGLDNIVIILSAPYVPLTLPLRGSEKGRLYENITLVSKIYRELKIIHALPQWNLEQRELINKFWHIRGIKKVFFNSRLACGIVISKNDKSFGLRPPVCSLFRNENYITWDGKLISCCHDTTGETSIGKLNLESPQVLIEKKKRITDRQFFYPICYECNDDRRYSTKGVIQRVLRQLVNSITS